MLTIFQPNTVSLGNVALFKNLDENPLVLIVVIVLWILYLIIIYFARKSDKRDRTQIGPVLLEDNKVTHKGQYEVVLITGARPGAGTTSNVYISMFGMQGNSGQRLLRHAWRPQFTRSSIDSFLLTTTRDLGAIEALTIRHDNSGRGGRGAKSWFLSRVRVTNLVTGEISFFACDRWLALDLDDGLIERHLVRQDESRIMDYKTRLTDRVVHGMQDGHLWVSIATRPPQSRFTRVQRTSVALVLIFLTMLSSALFYRSDSANLTVQQRIFVGVMSILIVSPFGLVDCSQPSAGVSI